MTVSAAALRRLDIEAPLGLLRRLASLARDAKPEAVPDLPRAILLLSSGQSVAGRVLRFEPHDAVRSDDTILLHCDSAPTAAQVCYIPVGLVAAVSISYAEGHLPHFSSGGIRAGDAIPSRLALQRSSRDMAERWSTLVGHALALELDWNAGGEEDDHRLMMGDTIAALDAAMRAWADDAEARASIAARLERIIIVFGTERDIVLADRRLVITFGRRAGELYGFNETELRREIERRL